MLCSGFLPLGQLDSSATCPTCLSLPVILSILPSSQNMEADALSRPSPVRPCPTFLVSIVQSLPYTSPVDFFELSSLQPSCPETTALLSNTSLCVVSMPSVESSVTSQQVHPILWFLFRFAAGSLTLQTTSLNPGVHPSRRLVSRAFIWSGLSKDVSEWARGCLHCQGSKVLQHVHFSVPQILIPARRFSRIHVDLVGPLPSFRGFTHLFAIMDRTSYWPEAVLLSLTSTEDCARDLVSYWISRFGVPAKITSARGAQYSSSLWGVLCSLLNI